jgi:hypothetical protein
MKHYIFVLFLVLLSLSVNAQVKQEVIASAGGYNVNSGLSISWTLGETIIPTFKSQDGKLSLSHGFQQQLLVTAVEENLDIVVNVKIFPNPASDVINIAFESPVEQEIVITLLDSQGKLVKSDLIEPAMTEKQINLQDVPGGVYYLRMTKGRLVNVYKVVKL